MKMEHKSDEYAKASVTKQIPCMQEINESTGYMLTLGESHAIMRYLAVSRGCPDHWYPSEDLRQQARINQYLDEHHNYLR